jgi:hypothetical protein
MRRNRRKRNNFYNQNIIKMNKKQFTITLTDFDTNQNLEIDNEGFEPFELMGVLVHVLERTKLKLYEQSKQNAHLEKEMD